jgi:hypothetical protein
LGVGPQFGFSLEQGPGAVFSRGEEARFAERLRLFGHLRLALAQELGELADRQLFLRTEGEQAQPILVAEESEQICASGQHDLSCIPLFE